MALNPTRKNLKAKADKLCGDIVRARGYCELAGKDHIRCSSVLQWCHIVGRANHRLRWELWNALCACSGHHVYYTNHPWEWQDLIREQFPENYELIQTHKNEMWDGFYLSVIERLKMEGSK